MKKLLELEQRIGYKFENFDLLVKAMTHSSYANEHRYEKKENIHFFHENLRHYYQKICDKKELKEQEEKYLDEITEDRQQISILTKVENPLIAGFLTVKIQEAERKGINVEYNCIFPKVKINMPEYQLIEMMGILLDNAIEAAEKMDASKLMQIRLLMVEGVINFSVTNTYLISDVKDISNFFAKGYSTKGNNRGIGLYKLKELMQKQKGELFCKEENINGQKAIRMEMLLPIGSQ